MAVNSIDVRCGNQVFFCKLNKQRPQEADFKFVLVGLSLTQVKSKSQQGSLVLDHEVLRFIRRATSTLYMSNILTLVLNPV